MNLIQLNPREHPLDAEKKARIERLLYVCNEIEKACGYPLVVDRGYSTEEEHIAIYKAMNAKRALDLMAPIAIPMGSAHLKAAAADLADPHRQLWDFLFEREPFRIELGIAMEARSYTPTWVHIQTYFPKSGKLIFKPY